MHRDRRKLAHWSDVATAVPGAGVIETEEAREQELLECLSYFQRLWREERRSDPSSNLISMMAHSRATCKMEPMEFLGNILLLIVGGSDTMRTSLTGSVVALHDFPDEHAKLRRGFGGKPSTGDHPLGDASCPYAPYRFARRGTKRPIHSCGRESGALVRVREPR
jgi:cytochrome P450